MPGLVAQFTDFSTRTMQRPQPAVVHCLGLAWYWSSLVELSQGREKPLTKFRDFILYKLVERHRAGDEEAEDISGIEDVPQEQWTPDMIKLAAAFDTLLGWGAEATNFNMPVDQFPCHVCLVWDLVEEYECRPIETTTPYWQRLVWPVVEVDSIPNGGFAKGFQELERILEGERGLFV